MNTKSIPKQLTLLAVSLLLLSLFVGTSSAQGPCVFGGCLSIDTSHAMLCDTCWDSVVVNPPPLPPDHYLVCDTCYTFALTNNCDSAIGEINISDPGAGGPLHHGCAVVLNPSHSTWTMKNEMGGSVTFKPSGSNPCLQKDETLLVSICRPLQQGDWIDINIVYCGGAVPCQGVNPCIPCPPEHVQVP